MIDDGKKNDDRVRTDEDASGLRSPVPRPPSPVPRPPSLKPEQQLAAHTLDRHVSVTAGPGAGKTTVLVERYLHILRNENISVDQIVAITFTNRAANEMRERLRHELDKILASAGSRERARWMRHKRTLDGAIITTIHGFCARLLREFPVEADLDPQFALLDAHQSSMLEESVAEETITEFISAQDLAITELAAGIGRVRLARGLIGIYRSMRNQGLTIEKLREEAGRNHKTIDDYNAALQELAAKMREFIQARGLTPSAEPKRREAERHWPALLESLSNVSASTPPAELASAILEFREAARPKAQGRIGETIKALDELLWDERLRGRLPQCFFDLHAARYTRELISVVEALERRLDEQKRRRSALDFDDLQLRALKLLEDHPEVMSRTSRRYRFFLVDEFQDTNSLQRKLTAKLALGRDRRANLFIVGDRKQSIYGFRGADVDVFREMTELIEAQNGLSLPLNRNFRSQLSLIRFFNFLFERVFEQNQLANDLNELGYVAHEASVAARVDDATSPVVELFVDVRESGNSDDKWSRLKPRERDAEQLARRIRSLVENESRERNEDASDKRAIHYRDVAMLFRAMTEVHIYESALRRAGIPYVTVDGKGFYAREEIADFIQLLRFLDNKTDEVAVAAVLRSPFCGLSDDALFALRCAPRVAGADAQGSMSRRKGVRPLLRALREHELISGIDDDDRAVLDRARDLLDEMIARARRSSVSELLRFAAETSEYRIVAAANFDGAQRLANIEKLFTLAERFERSGAYMIRDFVRFVRDFEEAGGRESEGQIDESADAVRLMSIHQSKGLEFPVVIIPDLHRQPDNRIEWWALDRHRGLTVKVPDGRGRLAAGSCFAMFGDRAKLREEFESMRLLYVAATRSEDRLILSGAAKDLKGLGGSWLEWVSRALESASESASRTLNLAEGVEVGLTVNLLDAEIGPSAEQAMRTVLPLPADDSFPLLAPVEAEGGTGLHRFSVTQLLNYSRCPRQYYFDRVLHTPSEDQLSVWNDADAPEPPANLTAALKGAVIHRFCERFAEGDDVRELLTKSFEEVLRQRTAELAERVLEIDPEKAVRNLLPLAENYVTSDVRRRIESARVVTPHSALRTPHSLTGVLSEQRFRLRRPLGILTGTIDKLLVSSSEADDRINIEIIDFKTNRFRGLKRNAESDPRLVISKQSASDAEQLSFGFLTQGRGAHLDQEEIVQSEIRAAADDYQIQMQAYALAARELIPEAGSVRVTLHFLDPNVEVSLPEELLEAGACARAIDEAMMSIVSSSAPESFDPKPADHCRVCNFSGFCDAGRQWLGRAQV